MAFSQFGQREGGGNDADRHVDPEDPVPVQPLSDRASNERAARYGESGKPTPDADYSSAAMGRKRRDEDRETEGGDDGGSDTLHRPSGDQHLLRRGQGTGT